MNKIDYKRLLFYIIITILIGSLPSIFISNDIKGYKLLNKPLLSPPSILFPIVWTILYILMGISMYLITKDNKEYKNYIIYFTQLTVNALWTIIFFGLKKYLLSFIWLILLILLVVYMIIVFYRINKKAGLLQITYLLWMIFAAYLNFGVYLLN